jgi:hypothetical protein
MDVNKLRYDSAAVARALVEEEETTSTKVECKIYIPSRYVERGLATLGSDVHILSVFAIVVGDAYALVKEIVMVKISPSETRHLTIGDQEYIEFVFAPGSVVIANKNVVMSDILNDDVYSYFIDDGKSAWYLSYDDSLTLFDNGKEFSGVSIAPHPAILSMMMAMVYRDSKDKMQYYRMVVGDPKAKPTTVAFHSVIHGPRSTMAALSGSYFDQAITTSLTHPTEKVSPIEKIVRL